MADVSGAILSERLVAIIRLAHYDRAVEVARALAAGGVRLLEFTLTGEGALEAIAAARAALGEAAVVGAGTVLSAANAEDSLAAGAQFLVTPAVVVPAIEAARRRGAPILCGALTPTEVLTAHQAGADFVKLFPARQGGPQYVRDLRGPLPNIRLVPTGGVGPENARAFLEAGAVAVAIGGNLVAEQVVAAGDWGELTERARACRRAIEGD
jgi:2-dehydro-3-deoxyphosphogluconate aldolase/(4S)-4-hydroxy-2-oxoglutarate aldolase